MAVFPIGSFRVYVLQRRDGLQAVTVTRAGRPIPLLPTGPTMELAPARTLRLIRVLEQLGDEYTDAETGALVRSCLGVLANGVDMVAA